MKKVLSFLNIFFIVNVFLIYLLSMFINIDFLFLFVLNLSFYLTLKLLIKGFYYKIDSCLFFGLINLWLFLVICFSKFFYVGIANFILIFLFSISNSSYLVGKYFFDKKLVRFSTYFLFFFIILLFIFLDKNLNM